MADTVRVYLGFSIDTNRPKNDADSTMKYSLVLLVIALSCVSFSSGKTFTRCSLAREMHRLRVPKDELAMYTCLAEHESGYRTDVVGPPNPNGTNDYGIFQINDYYWCAPPHGRFSYNECKYSCESLLSDDIERSVRCAEKVKRQQGFEAWSTYHFCRHTRSDEIDHCF
uniref:Glycosyl hydrolases family 22 (GH22) domain-containing protein n=1 Tax=Megaselia scalaris TaxID=36166 RepID=T1GLB4_MEGSC